MKNGRKAPRSRSGCKRCKERRFKCDEVKPECERCRAAGLPCPGYNKSLKWSTKHEIFPSSEKRRTQLAQPIVEPSHIIDGYGDCSITEPTINLSVENLSPIPPSSLGFEAVARFVTPTSTYLETIPELHQNRNEHFASSVSPFNPLLNDVPELPTPSSSLYGDPAHFSVVAEVEEIEKPGPFAESSIPKHKDSGGQDLVRRQSFFPTPMKGPSDFSTALVEYYFKETAGVFSCYDSNMNPFRTTVGNFWTLSPALHRTLQSMAAACLVNENPYFKRLCRSLRSEAMSLLLNAPDEDEKSLLALLMLGQSSSWFDPQDLGIPLFKTLKSKLNRDGPIEQGQLVRAVGDHAFFQEALEYWEMLLSFVSSEIPADTMDGPFSSPYTHARKVPHPWTGICRETQMLVNQVGQLVRAERIRARSTNFTWQTPIDESIKSLQFARYLESRLRSLSEPHDDEIVSPGDTETPVWHLQRIAEIYRRTGLINLYRVFPDLLLHHVHQHQPRETNTSGLQADITDSDNWLGLVEESRIDEAWDGDTSTWLTNFAIETIELLESIPPTSRTRCLQPFMLVVCASELRASPMEEEETIANMNFSHTPGTVGDEFFMSSTMEPSFPSAFSLPHSAFCVDGINLEPEKSSLTQAFRVFHARKFVRGRLNLFMNVLPPRPTKTCLDLVETVWDRLDEGDETVYWIDIMMDKGLHTTMG